MTPLAAAEFAALMARFEPFEPAPHVAAAVSGGADSLGLAFLLHDWVRHRGGRMTALTVDHRLRPGSGVEAARTGALLARHGIAHCTLAGAADLPHGNIEAAARALRYRLLEAWCREAGVLHLATGHHREDQAETFLLRLARGSGLDGLAAMPAVLERADSRILRPVLAVPRGRLAATLAVRGEERVAADPMNEDPTFARARLRQAAPVLAAEGFGTERLLATVENLGRARIALEAALAALLAEAVEPNPLGFAWLDPAPLRAAPEEVALRALAALLATFGGALYPPRLSGTQALWRDLRQGLAGARTLGGCLVAPRRGRVLICREAAAVAPPVAARAGARTCWDGRFTLTLPPDAPDGLWLGARRGEAADVPAPVRPTLAAVFDAAGKLSPLGVLRFRPVRSLTVQFLAAAGTCLPA